MNVFLFTGAPDQQFILQFSPDLLAWDESARLEFLDGTGTLLYVESAGADAASEMFYRLQRIR